MPCICGSDLVVVARFRAPAVPRLVCCRFCGWPLWAGMPRSVSVVIGGASARAHGVALYATHAAPDRSDPQSLFRVAGIGVELARLIHLIDNHSATPSNWRQF